MKRVLLSVLLFVLLTRCHGLIPRRCCDSGLLQRGGCTDGSKIIDLNCTRRFLLEDYNITEDGLTTLDTPGYVWTANSDEFCVGEMLRNRSGGVEEQVSVALMCFQQSDEEDIGSIPFKLFICAILSIISAVFIILTLAVYMLLPDLRDLQGKCIMCQCVCLAIAFLNLAAMQIGSPTFIFGDCAVNSFLLYFWMLATFFWMNVVSINTLRSITRASYLRKTETRQMVYYSLYAWGGPLAFLTAALITNYAEGVHANPRFGHNGQCWFRGSRETWLFFYGPIALLVTMNIIIFIVTSLMLWKTSKEYEVGTLNTLKYKFSLYLKLFLVTGITWVFEVASFAHGGYLIVWEIADLLNTLQGVTFFLLLVVCRRRALKGLAERGLGGAPVRWLLGRFRHDRENDNIVESENDHETPDTPFDVNLD